MAAQNSSIKRLRSELQTMMIEPTPPGISAFPDGENLSRWKGTIVGSETSPYADMQFTLEMTFPSNYPMCAPIVKFETPIFHPNIDMSGNICLDILKEKWSSAYSVTSLLLSIQLLLESPNNSSPLNGQAAQLWENREEFLRLAKRRYANLPLC